jgi:hypothetical protein
MALTEEEITLYTNRLNEAENALHLLMTGQQARVVVDSNGERVEFTATNKGQLRAYIAELKAALGKKPFSGPLNVWMGR